MKSSSFQSPFILKVIFQLFVKFVSLSIFPLTLCTELPNYLPLYQHNIDPSYEYLVNGISLLHLDSPGHLDHPGFTLQILIAFIFGSIFIIRYSLFGVPNLDIDFLNSTDTYSGTIIVVLILLSSASVIYLTLVLRKILKSNLAFLYPFLLLIQTDYFQYIVSVRPESLIFILSNLLISVLLNYLNCPELILIKSKVTIMALILSLGFFTKLIFVPFFIVFFLLKSFKDKLYFLFVFILLSIVLWTPIRNNLPYSWFKSILLEKGRHGEAVESKSFNSIYLNYLELNRSLTPLLIISLLSFTILIIAKLIKPDLFLYRNTLINTLFWPYLAFHALLLRENTINDFIPLIPLTSTFFIIILAIFLNRNLFFKRFDAIILTVTIFFFVELILPYLSIKQIANHPNNAILLSQSKFLDDSNIVISSYGAPTLFSAINFGNRYYGSNVLKNSMYNRFPNNIEFDIWQKKLFFSSNAEVTCNDLLTKSLSREIFIISRNISDFDKDLGINGFLIKVSRRLETYEPWGIYRLNQIKCFDN